MQMCIPDNSSSALPQATWVHVDRTNMTQTQKRKMAGYRLDVEDDIEDRRYMPLADSGQNREADWTTQKASLRAPEGT